MDQFKENQNKKNVLGFWKAGEDLKNSTVARKSDIACTASPLPVCSQALMDSLKHETEFIPLVKTMKERKNQASAVPGIEMASLREVSRVWVCEDKSINGFCWTGVGLSKRLKLNACGCDLLNLNHLFSPSKSPVWFRASVLTRLSGN